MWVQVQVEGDQLVALNSLLQDSGTRVLFDHCGRPQANAGLGQAGFTTLLSWAGTGRACVKLSGCAKFSRQAFPHADARPYVNALIEAFTPKALVWASDWPFLRAPARIDYGPLRAQVNDLLPNAEDQQAVLWDTPKKLLGFGL